MGDLHIYSIFYLPQHGRGRDRYSVGISFVFEVGVFVEVGDTFIRGVKAHYDFLPIWNLPKLSLVLHAIDDDARIKILSNRVKSPEFDRRLGRVAHIGDIPAIDLES